MYDCRWGTDEVRVIVAGELPQEAHNAPLHLFSASRELVGFGQSAYQQRSERMSGVLGRLFERLGGEGWAMPYTMEDFERDYIKDRFPRLTPEEQLEVLKSLPPERRLAGLPPEERLAGLSAKQIRQLLDRLTAGHPAQPRRPRWKR